MVDSMTYRRPDDDAITASRPRLDLSMSASVGDDNRYAGDSAVLCHTHTDTHTESPQVHWGHTDRQTDVQTMTLSQRLDHV